MNDAINEYVRIIMMMIWGRGRAKEVSLKRKSAACLIEFLPYDYSTDLGE